MFWENYFSEKELEQNGSEKTHLQTLDKGRGWMDGDDQPQQTETGK